MAATIQPRQEQLNQLYKQIFGEEEEKPPRAAPTGHISLEDGELLFKAMSAANSQKFNALWNGSTSGHGGDDSGADMALMDLLAFWTGCDAAQMERLFSQSGLGKRDKWRDRADYRDRTIKEAISKCTEVYNPGIRPDNPKVDLQDLQAQLASDPRAAIKDPAFLKELAKLRVSDPVEFELFVEEIKKSLKGVTGKTILSLVGKYAPKEAATKNEAPKAETITKVSEDIQKTAREILKHGDPIKARLDYCKKAVMGDGSVEKVLVYSAYSTFMPESDKLHMDVVGSSQVGKTARVGAVLSTFPQENVIMLTEASPKSLYYMQRTYAEQDISLSDKIIYLDDARPEHVPLLKSFRNDGPITPRNATVADGEFIDIPIEGRPVIIASSVVPLRDLEGQATSRTFLGAVSDPTPEDEIEIRTKIRKHLEAGGLVVKGEDQDKTLLQEIVRITKDEGISSVVVPFDAREPDSADRRGTGQFIRLIKISAYIHQFQRPVLEMIDGSTHVLAIYEDLKNAAKLWFAFDTAQEFKISDKHVRILKELLETEPTEEYGMTVSRLAMKPEIKAVMSQKTVSRYLEDLYDNGLVYKRQIKAAGSPFAYWADAEIRQRVMSEISTSADGKVESGQIKTISKCPKYMAKNSSDSLIDSIKEFFSNKDIIREKDIRRIVDWSGREMEGNFSSYLSLFSNSVLNTPKEPDDSDSSEQGDCPDSGDGAPDAGIVGKGDLSQLAVGCPEGQIEADLQKVEALRAQKEEHDKTPPLEKCARCSKPLIGGSLEVGGQIICLKCFNLEADT